MVADGRLEVLLKELLKEMVVENQKKAA